MKIVLDVSQMVYQGTGVGRYMLGLTQALILANTKHEIILYAGVRKRKSDLVKLSNSAPYNRAEWKMYPLPPRLAAAIFNHTSLPINVFVGKHDIFHASDWTEPVTRGIAVTTVHDLAFRLHPETIEPTVRETQTLRLNRIVDHKSHIIADSESTKNDLMKLYKVPSERIDVIYPGIDPVFMPQKTQEIERVKTKYKINGKYVLAVGTREPRKNLERVIAAFQAFHQTAAGQDYSLVIAGRHGWGNDHQLTASEVITTGFVDELDLPGLYSGAKVFVCPSLYEGFGFPVAEAMACGVPVVTSDVSSLPEVAGDAGILVSPTDESAITRGIVKAINDHDRLVELGFPQSAKFSWSNTARKTLEVYEKIARN